MSRGKLSTKEIRTGLCNLDGWSLVKGNLHRTFEFKDFKQAFVFMKRVAVAADRMDHHPNWSNVCTDATDSGCTGGTFGQVTAAHDPRIMQLGGKVTF